MSRDSHPAKPRFSANARLILERRYLRRDEENRVVETPAQMMARVARTVAQADARYGPGKSVRKTGDRFYELMASLDFLPNSPTLMNAGRELGQLAACFVIPIEDSIESIFNAVRDTALIHKSGGGTGFSFSAIRPARDLVKSTRGVSSGPLSFMTVFDVATETIKQGGVRRGANMGVLSVHHPDILEFIAIKTNHPDRFTNFNLSVAVTDVFMEAVLSGREYELVNPHTQDIQGHLRAPEVFARLVQAAWCCGDPGLIFIDRINQANPVPLLGRMEATNPCGEQPLLPFESCNLGSINLSRFVKAGSVDYNRLGPVVRLAVHFLDNVIDINRFPLPRIAEMTLKSRKIGLGVMGLADLLVRLKIPYDSEKALEVCRGIMAFIRDEARAASAGLAKHRGNFPAFEGSLYHRQGLKYMRNATTTTIAPTGTLSIMAGCSSGIEPLFALAYRRRVMDNQELVEVNRYFKRIARARGFWSETLAEELSRRGSVRGLASVPEDVRSIFVTAYEVSPRQHLEVQAAFQAYTDNAVSKTVNLPRQAGPEEIRDVFLYAYQLGLKGVTVYRDGSRPRQVLSVGPRRPEGEAGRTWDSDLCPECGQPLQFDQGCRFCPACGFSHCA